MPLRYILIPQDVIWPLQCSYYFLEGYDKNLFKSYRECNGVFMNDFLVYRTSFDECLINLSKVLSEMIV
jgi:hypothetical protein